MFRLRQQAKRLMRGARLRTHRLNGVDSGRGSSGYSAYNPAMHHPYYIKMVYGSTNPDDRPWREGKEDYLHFREEQQLLCNHFGDATGFLVYETKHSRGGSDGSQTIFARGSIESLGCENVWAKQQIEDDYGNRYPLGVKVRFEKIVSPDKGLTREQVYQLCPRLENHFGQAKGGLIGITLEEFKALSAALDKC